MLPKEYWERSDLSLSLDRCDKLSILDGCDEPKPLKRWYRLPLPDCFAFTFPFLSSIKSSSWEQNLTSLGLTSSSNGEDTLGYAAAALFFLSLVATITYRYWKQWVNSLNPGLLTWHLVKMTSS